MDIGEIEVLRGTAGPGAPLVYVIDSSEHPLGVPAAARGLMANVARVPVGCWGDSLTPWPAPPLGAGMEGFGGRAGETLAALARDLGPSAEAGAGLAPRCRAICGYSLGGLFSLYALAREGGLRACACLSGSVWYEGWVDWLRENAPECSGRYAFLSVGRREKRAGLPFRHVEEDLAACAGILRGRGCRVDVSLGPGGHMQYRRERLAAGLAALDAFLAAP